MNTDFQISMNDYITYFTREGRVVAILPILEGTDHDYRVELGKNFEWNHYCLRGMRAACMLKNADVNKMFEDPRNDWQILQEDNTLLHNFDE
jgi:hypothetical protein